MNTSYANQQMQSLNNAPPQATEGWAMIEMARRLDAAAKMDEGAEREAALLDLVRRNWRMWTILQAALVDPECTVPQQIRENLLSLSNFIDKRSVECLSDVTPEKVAILVSINRQIGSGLMGNPSDDPEEAERLRAEAAQKQADSQPEQSEESSAAPSSSPTEHQHISTDTEA